MNYIIRPLYIIRNHWKKSIFYSCVAFYGIDQLRIRSKINKMMTSYCIEASKFGNQTIPFYRDVRHVTAILNPEAGSRKGKNLFLRYSEPLFHCAGIKLSIMETESEGQAKELMKIMTNTDAVVIVGGNGTIHEALNGYFNRDDRKIIPIGFIPIGKINSIALGWFGLSEKYWKGKEKIEQASIIAKASMNIIKEALKKSDVIKVDLKKDKTSVYALDGINFGFLRDSLEKIDNYWYLWGRIKPYYTFLIEILFKGASLLNIPQELKISYIEPCKGCSKCYSRFKDFKQQRNRRWWHMFVPSGRREVRKEIDYSKIQNERCGIEKQLITKPLINVKVQNSFEKDEVKLILHHKNQFNKRSLINEGVRMYKQAGSTLDQIESYTAREISIKVIPQSKSLNKNTVIALDSIHSENDENNTDKSLNKREKRRFYWMSIDSKNYPVQDITLTLLPKKIILYC